MTCLCKKALTHENLSFCIIANNISFHEKETSFHILELYSKIAFSTFLSLRKNLFSIRGPWILFHLLSCTNTACVLSSNSISVLSSWKKSSKHENLSLHCNNIHFMRKKYLSCTWAYTLKIAFSNFLSLRKKLFSIRGLGFSSSCLVALNTALVFLEALNQWFCALKL